MKCPGGIRGGSEGVSPPSAARVQVYAPPGSAVPPAGLALSHSRVLSYRPRMRSIPEKIPSIGLFGTLPTRSLSCRLSIVTSCVTLATESRSSPVCLALSKTLPGAIDQCRLLVRTTQATVAIWLRLSASG